MKLLYFRHFRNINLLVQPLDVYEAEPNVADGFKKLDNVILTPHIGNASFEARDAMAEIVATNAVNVLNGEAAKYIVNR